MTQNDEKKVIVTATSTFEQKSPSLHVEHAGGHILRRPWRDNCAAVAADVLAENNKNDSTCTIMADILVAIKHSIDIAFPC